MTEQEAQAFAARLARVWGALILVEVRRGTPYFAGLLSQDVELRVGIIMGSCHFSLHSPHEIASLSDFLYCEDDWDSTRHSWISCPISRFLSTRQTEWLPRFRRGCWLSGSNIEANMHEKMEWIQGFTQEELEAWNLKM